MLRPVASGCHGCSSSSCGVNAFAGLLGKRERLLKIANPGGYQLGQVVEVLFHERLFVRLVLLQYLLPLISMIVVAVIGGILSNHPYIQIVATVIGLLIGVLLARKLISAMEQRLSGQLVQLQPGINTELFKSQVNS